jgi:hypothetical protein
MSFLEPPSETDVREVLGMSPRTENELLSTAGPSLAEHRRHARFPLTALVEVLEPESNVQILGRSSDVSLSGCYVDTLNPFPAGTIIRVRLTRDSTTFEANAKVVNSQMGMGMGIAFTSAEKDQFQIYQKWIDKISGNSSPEELVEKPKGGAAADFYREQYYVLNDLVVALMRKGVLEEAEGKAMLDKLHK